MKQKRNCFKDEGRLCNQTCAAFNEEEIEGTNCIELAARYATARGLVSVGMSIRQVNATIHQLVGQASGR